MAGGLPDTEGAAKRHLGFVEMKKRQAIRTAKRDFRKGRYPGLRSFAIPYQPHRRHGIYYPEVFDETYRQGVQVLLTAGCADAARKLVEREIARTKKRLDRARVNLRSAGEIPEHHPHPHTKYRVYYPEDISKIRTIEQAGDLNSLIKYSEQTLEALAELQETIWQVDRSPEQLGEHPV